MSKKIVGHLIFLGFPFLMLPLFAEATISSIPTPVIKLPENKASLRKDYLAFLKRFEKKFCTIDTKKKFDQLAKKRKSLAAYVPDLMDGSIDIETIRDGQSELNKKWEWLIATRQKLRENKEWPNRWKLFEDMEATLEKLLLLKEKRFFKKDKSANTLEASRKELAKLKSEFNRIVGKIHFLTSYNYPVDHLAQRAKYEAVKERSTSNETREANEIMFQRQLEEDGTFDDNQRNQDTFLRTTLNTLKLAIDNEKDWISENVRHDLEWTIGEIKRHLKWGRARQIGRIQNWINKTHESREFYQKLLNDKNGVEERRLFVERQEAGRQLKDFVYETNAEVYKYLNSQDELTQALHVFDQILLHEVGNADVRNYRDRRDVAQVIINSRFDDELSKIDSDETLYPYLIRAGVPKSSMANSSWLNVMFRALRFSFTLYYIPAVKHVFCPDFYKLARNTRYKNLFLITDVVEEPNTDFKAVRYFSRWSMTGRIDMSQVWEGFEKIPERVGARYKEDNGLKGAIRTGKYRYLYSFKDPRDTEYHVLEIGGRPYALKGTLQDPKFFAYRDPHNFRFFREK